LKNRGPERRHDLASERDGPDHCPKEFGVQKQLENPVTNDGATCPFDHRSPDLLGAAKYDVYAGLRERRVQRSDAYGGFWILSQAADVEAALLDHETFSSQRTGVMLPPTPPETVLSGLEHDPPEHGPYRRLFSQAVSRVALKVAEPEIEALTARVVTRFAESGGGDFVTEVGSVLPVEVIALVIGLPPDKATRLREITEVVWANLATDPHCFDPLIALITTEIEARRAQPRDDFLSHLAGLTMLGDRPITDQDVRAVVAGLLIAGHETTMDASANLALQLAREPDLRARVVADATVVPAVVEEVLRLDSPVQNFMRTLTRDVEINGTTMHEDDRVMLIYGSANHDPHVFDHPDTFDPDRANLKHYSFGWGLHRCVGAMLAQMELRILCRLLATYDFKVVGEPEYLPPAGPFTGLHSLKLAFS